MILPSSVWPLCAGTGQAASATHGYSCYKESKQSVFASPVAQDVAAVLTAIMEPFNEAKVKRALLTRLLGFNLKKLIELQEQSEGLNRYIADFDAIREMWFEKGF